MMILDTSTVYKELDYKGINYTNCRDFPYISRYRGLRQVIHSPEDTDIRFTSLEIPNAIGGEHINFVWHEVVETEVNRLDLIAYKYLGSAQYNWVIAYYNGISDGFTCNTGEKLRIPSSISELMKDGELLQTVPVLTLNLGSE